MRKHRKSRRLGRFLLLIPIAVFGIIVLLSLQYFAGPGNGVLVVEAHGIGASGGTTQLSVPATVNGRSIQTPYNATLPVGEYAVEFQAVKWYVTPPNDTVYVLGAKTAYAIGDYLPLKDMVGVTESGFNQTAIQALHGVTPVEWVNLESGYVTLHITQIGTIVLGPGENYTTIFTAPGEYTYAIFGTTISGTASVT